jgi:hypothetical protein
METSSKIRQTTNERIYDRNLPSNILQPYLDARPRSTRFQIMPIVETGRPSTVRLEQEPRYELSKTFNPGNRPSPWSGYQVQKESELRNQLFALQACSQNVYVPSSHSDLYQSTVPMPTKDMQPFRELFRQEKWEPFDPNPMKLGKMAFLNDTRQQRRVAKPGCNE